MGADAVAWALGAPDHEVHFVQAALMARRQVQEADRREREFDRHFTMALMAKEASQRG